MIKEIKSSSKNITISELSSDIKEINEEIEKLKLITPSKLSKI